MKKTLVAIAALAAVTGAMAEATISGHLDQGLTGENGQVGGKTSYTYSGLMSVDSPSFIVFAGTEAIEGTGLKASFHIENGLGINGSNLLAANTTWNATSSTNRETWVGLNGEFGDVKMGLQYTPIFFTVLGNDPGGLNNAAGVLAAGQLNSAGLFANNNATTYTTPSFSGVTFSAQIQSGTYNSAFASTNQGNGFGYSLAFSNGPLNASVAYNSTAVSGTSQFFYGGATSLGTTSSATTGTGNRFTTVTTTAGDSYTATGVGVSYDFVGFAKVSYLNTQTALNSYSSNYSLAGITVPLAGGAASIGYSYSSGNVSTSSTANITQNGQQLIGYYNFSKRTKAYLVYGNAKDTTNNDSITITSIGIGHNF